MTLALLGLLFRFSFRSRGHLWSRVRGLCCGCSWIMYRALVVGAYGDGGAYAFSVDDDRGLGCFARKHWLRIGVFDSILNLAEVPALHGSGPLLSCVPPAVLDLDKLGTGCNLAVDVRGELDLIAGSVEAVVASERHKTGKCCIRCDGGK